MTATFTFTTTSCASVNIEFDAKDIEGMSEKEAYMYLKETYECEAETQASHNMENVAKYVDICIDED